MSEAWSSGSDSRWRAFRTTILERDHWTCTLRTPVCTGRAEHVHHRQPLSRGGAKYDPANATASCEACNLELGNRAPVPQPEPRPVSRW